MFIKYCKRRDQTSQTLSIQSSASIGLDNRVLNTIPILFYSSKTRDLYRINQGDQCVICLQQLNKGDLIRCLPNCGHVFHVPCIDHWFHAHITCPICRAPVRAGARALPRTRSGGVLRHSTKLVLPIQGLGPRDLVNSGLKRSLSMDECCVVVDTNEAQTSSSSSSSLLDTNNNSNNPCTNPPLSKIEFLLSRLYQANSYRRFNHNRRGGTLRNNGVLPY
ncbi:RING-H2 finger protein ATL32 [Bienertia sinuspersici]